MEKNKTKVEAAAGKLISSIQKEWGNEVGEPEAEESEEIMYKGHDLLTGAKNNNVSDVLNGMNVTLTTDISVASLLPAWLTLLLIAMLSLGAWLREGRR